MKLVAPVSGSRVDALVFAADHAIEVEGGFFRFVAEQTPAEIDFALALTDGDQAAVEGFHLPLGECRNGGENETGKHPAAG